MSGLNEAEGILVLNGTESVVRDNVIEAVSRVVVAKTVQTI